MDEDDNRYRRSPVTLSGVVGCLTWPGAVLLFFDPMFDLILGPHYFEAYRGPLGGLAIFGPLVAALVAATVASVMLHKFIRYLFGRGGDRLE